MSEPPVELGRSEVRIGAGKERLIGQFEAIVECLPIADDFPRALVIRENLADDLIHVGVVVTRTGGHTPGHSVVRLASRGNRLMFAGDALFPVWFDHPEWHNGFEHDPEEATRVRVRLMRELAATGESLMATHLPFPSVGRVAVAGDLFRWVPTWWDY